MNFSDLASIGAGGGEAMSIEAGLFVAPAVTEDTVGEQADSDGGDTFAALLGLLVGPSPTPPWPPPEVAALPSGVAVVAAEITPDLMAAVTGGQRALGADDRSQRPRDAVAPVAAVPVPVDDRLELPSSPVDSAALVTAAATGEAAVELPTDADVPTGAVGPLPFTRAQPSRVALDSLAGVLHLQRGAAPRLQVDLPAPLQPTAALQGAVNPSVPTEPTAVLQGAAAAIPPAPGVGVEHRATIDLAMPATALVAPALAPKPVAEPVPVDQGEVAQPVAQDPAVSPVSKPAAIVQAVAQVEAATRAAVGSGSGVEPAVSPSPITPPAQAPMGGGGEAFEHDDAPGQATPQVVQGPRAVAVVTDVPVRFSDALQTPIPVSPAAPVWLPAAGEIDELPDLTPQIIRSVRMQVAGDVGHARVHLRPEHLGELVVDLRVDEGDVIATIRSDVREVREWIQARSEELRSALGASGLTLVHVAVNEREARKGKGQEAEVKDGAKARKSKDREAGRVFEIAA